jgi:hydroxymethylglutaryl-CoA lyase
MQGLHDFIPTEKKAEYINALLEVGFDTIDFGSFVSPKAIPQMRDTAQLLDLLALDTTKSKLLAIVANQRGATDAANFSQIDYIGFPLSLSETFQQRNTNKSIGEAFTELSAIQEIVLKADKTLVVYLSMGFGNPYNDPFEMAFVAEFVARLQKIDVQIIALSDTIGVSTPASITTIFTEVAAAFQAIEFGVHLHSTKASAATKIEAAHSAGCRRIDSTVLGIGGCPMAKDDLVGNIDTQQVLTYLNSIGEMPSINQSAWEKSLGLASKLFMQA